MTTPAPRISVFPKCYFDELVSGQRDYVGWIRDAATLGGEGVEHYDEFFRSLDAEGRRPGHRRDARDRADLVDALLLARLHARRCRRAGAAGRAAEGRDRPLGPARHALLPHAHRAALPARRAAPRASRRSVECITRSLDYAEKRDVILCLENHYKVGDWLLSRVRAEGGRLPRGDRADRLAALRRPVRSVERGGRRLRSDRVPREGQAPRRDDARVRSVPGAGHDASTRSGWRTARWAIPTS